MLTHHYISIDLIGSNYQRIGSWSKIANNGTANNVNKMQSIRPSSVFWSVIFDQKHISENFRSFSPIVKNGHFLRYDMTVTNSGRHRTHEQKRVIKSPISHITIFTQFRICSNARNDFKCRFKVAEEFLSCKYFLVKFRPELDCFQKHFRHHSTSYIKLFVRKFSKFYWPGNFLPNFQIIFPDF